jgi:kynurenine formamidase
MAKEAWGRWGSFDEKGATNLIGSDKVRGSVNLVKQGRVISLAQQLSPNTPVAKHRARIMHFMGRDGGDYAAGARRPGGFQFAEDTLIMPVHSATHIDAFCHVWYDDALYNGFDSAGIRSNGAAHCGVDKLPPIVSRGILLDIVGLRGAPLEPGALIGKAEVRAALDAAGAKIEPGDVVLIRTGWQEALDGMTNANFDTEPGIDLGAAEWLAEEQVALIGADNFGIEVIPFPNNTVFPVHQRLIRDFGIPLLEGLVLKTLAEAGGRTFLFVAAPLPIVNATGSPLTPLAVL